MAMNSIPERDWKVVSKLHGTLVERFCERVLNDVSGAATNPRQEPSERFSNVAGLMRQAAKDLNDLADHRRSTAFFVIARMRNRENLFLPGEFEQFSQQTRDEVDGLRRLQEGG